MEEKKSGYMDWEVIFDSIGDTIFIADNSNTIVKANKAFADLFGKDVKDIVGKKCYELMHKSKKPWPGCPFEKSKADKMTHTEEVNDPQIGTPLLVTTSPVFDRSGRMTGIVHVAKDITSLKKIEKTVQDQRAALEESEMKYKTLYDSSGDAIMILDSAKGFVSGNRATLKLFACDNEKQFTSLNPSGVSPDYQPDGSPSPQKAREMMALALKNGSYLFEWKHKRLNGEEFFASVLLTRLVLKGVTVLQATVRDISEQKRADEKLKDKIEELERFQQITVGRELRMKELKARIARLEAMSPGNKEEEQR